MRARALAAALAVLCLALGVAAQKTRVFAADGCIEKVPPPPAELRGRAVNESAITVTWKTPPGDACVDTYEYYVLEKGQPQPRTLPTKSREAYSLTVSNLKPNTDYHIYVASVNALKGRSKFADTIVRTRSQRCTIFSMQRPGAVSDIQFTQTSPYYAFLSWLPPETGCTTWYRIETFDPSGRRVGSSVSIDADHVVRVQPNNRYDVRVTPASLFGGSGPTSRATLNTGAAGPRGG